MEHILSFFKAMSDETRLRLMLLLAHQSHCVCELSEILDISQPKISKHLSKLRDLGFVETTRDAQFIYYKINETHPAIDQMIKTLIDYAKSDETIKKDLSKIPQCTALVKKGKV